MTSQSETPRQIRAVYFDVGETLINESTEYGTWADWLGVPRHTFFSMFGQVIASAQDHREVFQHFKPGFNLALERQRRAEAGLAEHFNGRDLYPDVRECLAALTSDGYFVGVAGNQTGRAGRLLHWEYGTPPRQESELAWVQHALTQVEPGGTVVVLMPPGAAFRPSGRRIRRELLVRGALQAVCSLPAGLATHYALALQIWVLRRPADTTHPTHLLVVDTGGNTTAGSEAWERVAETISAHWSAYRAGPTGFVEQAGVARSVPLEELLNDDVDVTPRRSLPLPASTNLTVGELAAARERLAKLLTAVNLDLPDPPDAEPARAVALPDLAATGAVFIRRAARGSRDDRTVPGRILTSADLAVGGPPSQEGEVDADNVRNPPIRSGDILVPVVTRRLTARVATAEDVGAYPAATVYVVRTDPAVLDPWFLAGYLSSADGGRQAERLGSSLGGATRVDLRRVRVPLLPIAAQREYGQRYRILAEFSQNLRAAHDLGLELARNATDAITAGLTGRTH